MNEYDGRFGYCKECKRPLGQRDVWVFMDEHVQCVARRFRALPDGSAIRLSHEELDALFDLDPVLFDGTRYRIFPMADFRGTRHTMDGEEFRK